jgi:alpha-L-fucosidase 2
LPYSIGSKGQLLEWSDEWKAVDPSHRHLSHLYPVFPGSEISPAVTPVLSGAAKKALALREKTNCSWGFAWKAACWARLREADSAWQTWQYQLRWVDPKSTSSLNNYGLFPNLFNSDGRDVIMNGNGCATAVMVEMLVQSHTGAIELLPALPKIFPAGNAKGIKTRGGFVVDLEWKEGQLKNAAIYSGLGNECRLRMYVKPDVRSGDKKIVVNSMGKNGYSFKTVRGKKYYLRISNTKL